MRHRPENRLPDWRNIASVLEGGCPSRPTLFELFLNDRLIQSVSGVNTPPGNMANHATAAIRANDLLGYDYTILFGSEFAYHTNRIQHAQTVSLNEGFPIFDRASFDSYAWPDPDQSDYSLLNKAAEALPDGMKLMIWSADGLLETVIKLLGYENLCFLLYDDEQLVADVFEKVGKGYLEYFKRCVTHESVMAIVSSDDWGFNTQTLLSADTMRKYLFPWQRAYVKLAHSHGKYAVLHSCGYFEAILDDILDMGFDARHSYEDAILPVEAAYERLNGSIAVLGGLDVDFLIRSSEEEIRERARKMLALSAKRGGYALGSGNSIADYIPDEHYFAMIDAAFE
ncbi:MAG: hypothetical protein FWG94_03710 [Oscillospiraceae bacterium]|nr:hypothetical protein [Oscillospiraceae bacterium]